MKHTTKNVGCRDEMVTPVILAEKFQN